MSDKTLEAIKKREERSRKALGLPLPKPKKDKSAK